MSNAQNERAAVWPASIARCSDWPMVLLVPTASATFWRATGSTGKLCHPSGRVTAKPLSGSSMRPVVAWLAAAVAAALAEALAAAVAVGAGVAVAVAVGLGEVVVPPQPNTTTVVIVSSADLAMVVRVMRSPW